MRNEPLTAYSLHQRSYQDKRSIYYLLTKEYGILHGVAKKGIPQFSPLTLFATGKKSLKTFQQVTITDNVPILAGTHQYTALYVNEITLKLLPPEDKVANIYNHYEQVINTLQQTPSDTELRMALRIYENVLFEELGFAVDLWLDANQKMIDVNTAYYYSASSGWIPVDKNNKNASSTPNGSILEDGQFNDNPNHTFNESAVRFKPNSLSSELTILASYDKTPSNKATSNKVSNNKSVETPYDMRIVEGSDIVKMREGINLQTIGQWSSIHKDLIDLLFDYQPLQSRILWQQYHRYQ